MYRYTRRTPLSTGQKKGAIIRDGELKAKTIKAFLASGTLVHVSTPPLTELPDWEARAELLRKAGIITIQDLIEASPAQLVKAIKKARTTVRRWQIDAKKAIEIEPPDDHN